MATDLIKMPKISKKLFEANDKSKAAAAKSLFKKEQDQKKWEKAKDKADQKTKNKGKGPSKCWVWGKTYKKGHKDLCYARDKSCIWCEQEDWSHGYQCKGGAPQTTKMKSVF